MQFVVHLKNPAESDAGQCQILERFDDEIAAYDGLAPAAGETAIYKLEMNDAKLRFDYDRMPIYCCARTSANLEKAAFAALNQSYNQIGSQLVAATNQFLARRMPDDVEHAVILLDVPCECGGPHQVIFYRPFRLDGSDIPEPDAMLLADVSGTDVHNALTGILSKTDFMDALEKLIARWRLLSDQILIPTPFVAHQWKTKAERLAVWERLLGLLDATRTVLVKRGSSYTEYKKALLDSGLDHSVLVRFGLENQLVGAGRKKQDFHAKIYIGLGDPSEVLSGSANVVRGDSKENATFLPSDRARVASRYLEPLGIDLPVPRPRATYHVLVTSVGGVWRWAVGEGPAPTG